LNLQHLPSSPWVYLFKDRKEKILYVGKAKDLSKRVSQYFTPWSVWKQDMLMKAVRVDFIEVTTESEALYLEDNLIKTNNPEYNRLLKWDNSYVYLKITKEDFPQIFITRMRKMTDVPTSDQKTIPEISKNSCITFVRFTNTELWNQENLDKESCPLISIFDSIKVDLSLLNSKTTSMQEMKLYKRHDSSSTRHTPNTKKNINKSSDQFLHFLKGIPKK
jgi:predicted GIY-YIG superfamily endonuclease